MWTSRGTHAADAVDARSAMSTAAIGKGSHLAGPEVRQTGLVEEASRVCWYPLVPEREVQPDHAFRFGGGTQLVALHHGQLPLLQLQTSVLHFPGSIFCTGMRWPA